MQTDGEAGLERRQGVNLALVYRDLHKSALFIDIKYGGDTGGGRI